MYCFSYYKPCLFRVHVCIYFLLKILKKAICDFVLVETEVILFTEIEFHQHHVGEA